MLKFILFVVVAMGLLLGVTYEGDQRQLWTVMPSFAIEIVLFVGVTTIVIYYFLARHAPSPSFTQAYLLSMVLKMGGYATFVVVIIFSDKPGATANAILFLVSYLVFTGLEVGFLFKRINR